MIYRINTIDDNTTYFQVGERLNNGIHWLYPKCLTQVYMLAAHSHDLNHFNYAGNIANSVEGTLEFTWQITNDGYYTWYLERLVQVVIHH